MQTVRMDAAHFARPDAWNFIEKVVETMASISGTSSVSSILSSMSGKRVTGLVSGMDTDELVKNMTATTRSKIAKQQQLKQKASWKMDAYRSISSKLIAFQNKFTSYTSSTNLRSPSFYSKSQITAVGNSDYSKYVKASGNGEKLGTATIAGVKQLATRTSYISSAGSVSASESFTSGTINASSGVSVSKLAGETISLKYGNETVSLTLAKDASYTSYSEVNAALQNALKDAGYDEKIEMSVGNDGQLTIRDKKQAGNSIEVKKVGAGFGDLFGIKEGDKTTADSAVITGSKKPTEQEIKAAVTTSNLPTALAGKTLTFSYNGKSTTVTLGTAEALSEGGDVMKNVQAQIQKQLDAAYGSGRVSVKWENDKLSFATTYPDGNKDKTSTLALTGGDAEALKALSLSSGMSNRLNTQAALKDSGMNFKGISALGSLGKDDYKIVIKDQISGQTYEISKTTDGKAFDENTTMDQIIQAINASDAKVKVSYLSTSDQLSITSTQDGASGDFAIVDDGNTRNLGTAIFGRGIKGMKDAANGTEQGEADYFVTNGQDAIIYVDYDGEGGAKPTELTRSSNTFDINGVSVTVSGVFNMTTDAGGNTVLDEAAEDVSFEAKADTEKITKAFKEMIDAYNEIVELSNKLVSTKPDRSYSPLSEEQKEDMTETEIKNWEEKAKEGMLFNDSDLRNFTNGIRFLFEGNSQTIKALESMGITSASSYSNNGKINFNEETFKNALETNLEGVKEMFTAAEKTITDESGKTVTKAGGIMNQIKSVFDKYAAVDTATKGVFVQMAGATESPLSMLDNYLQKQMDQYDDLISTLQEKLKDAAERYYNQFSNLEVYINNMNSQSSWLFSQTSGS